MGGDSGGSTVDPVANASSSLAQIFASMLDFVSKILDDIDDHNYAGACFRCVITCQVFLFGMFLGVLTAFWIEDAGNLLWAIFIAMIVLTFVLLGLLVVRRPDDRNLATAQALRAERIAPIPISDAGPPANPS